MSEVAVEPAATNEEQVRYWNEVSGPTWVAYQERLDLQIAPLGEIAMERGAPARGESVLDVGCGCGDSTLALARRVGTPGLALGVDVSRPMLDRARVRANEAGLAQVRFEEADAQHASLDAGAFDLLFSRFGVMFFSDPVAAFANLRRALRPRGRLSFVCWQALGENPWMTIPVAAAARHVPFPAPPPPGAPGPFAFADADRVRGILEAAGFERVGFEDVRRPLLMAGGELGDAVELMLRIGPAAAALREANASQELRETVADAVREALAPYASRGGVRMPSASWIVTARNPESR